VSFDATNEREAFPVARRRGSALRVGTTLRLYSRECRMTTSKLLMIGVAALAVLCGRNGEAQTYYDCYAGQSCVFGPTCYTCNSGSCIPTASDAGCGCDFTSGGCQPYQRCAYASGGCLDTDGTGPCPWRTPQSIDHGASDATIRLDSAGGKSNLSRGRPVGSVSG
jgi:hypothetical protein